ncbi:THUMP domain-containing protein [Thermococcus sp. Bubb.Bath]|uniref:THUMP domain-containing protein n=1 Tax=Thermococcus sp. Bubb.Bath TaxID=1638242 RepID=UPI00143AA10E|nr:THUMP domain-containing protein [Thermococcus sp. Bubb.Bath]NJF25845.1 RNA-binding protein [Thermococcus sp. Bubb.Bath]
MVVLVVTCPQGREGDVILELEWALENVRAHGTDWRGVLIAETPLSKEEILSRLRSFETQAIQKVIPLEEAIPADYDAIRDAVLKLMKGREGTFAVRARVRGNKRLSARELEIKLGSEIVEAFGLPVNLSDPDWTVVVEVFGKRVYVGVLGREEMLKFEVKE